eukprot:6184005-Pleurochrysis_carterae.AAC.4
MHNWTLPLNHTAMICVHSTNSGCGTDSRHLKGSELARAGDRYNRHQPRGHSRHMRFTGRPWHSGSR